MKRKFILDEEISLIESNDLLNTKVYADNLKAAIENAPENKSFTIGLFGEWGSGKSSIIKTVQEALEKQSRIKTKFIIYDSWKYSNDSFRRMFLLELQNVLNFEKGSLMSPFYSNDSEEAKVKIKANSKKLFIMGFVLLVLLVIVNLIDISGDWKLGLSTLIPLAGLLITISTRLFDEVKVTIQKPHLFAPEQFEDCFREMVLKSMKHHTWLEKGICYVKGENYEKDIERLIIVIDNIDRCHKEMAYELLTNIKNFLGNPYNIIFIIPVDDSALRKHIISNSKEVEAGNHDKEAEEFLRKFLNTTIRIKPYHPEEMYEFAEKMNIKYNLGFSPDTIDIVSKEYVHNPRRIIQFYNNLSLELRSYPDEFIKQFESVICKILIIREEFPDYYNKLSMNPYILHDPIEKKTKEENKICPELNNFLMSTRVVSQNISSDILKKILSNSIVFSGITQEISRAIDAVDMPVISKFIEEDINRKDIVIKYIIERLKKGVSRGSFDSAVIPNFDLIASLNEKYPFDISQNNKVYEIIQDATTLAPIFEKNNITNSITYCNATYEQGLKYLTNYVISRINEEIASHDQPDERWASALKKVIKTFSDITILGTIKDSFKKYYFIDNSILDFKYFSYVQIESLVSNNLFIEIVNRIQTLNRDDKYFSDLMSLAEGISISDEIAIHLISKMNQLHPNFDLKTIEEINNYIQIFNSCLELTKNDLSEKNTELTNLYTIVCSDRKIPNPNPQLANSRPHDQTVNFINQSVNDSDIVNSIIIFCCHIYRLTRARVSINTVINQILGNPNNRDLVNSHFVDLLKSFSLNPLNDIVLSDTTYKDNSFKLLKNALTRKALKKYTVPEDILTAKLTEMLELVYNDDVRSNRILGFLEDIIPDNRVKETLTKLIPIQSKENILKLSTTLQSLAIDAVVSGENIFGFTNNIEFLKVVAANGKPIHIQALTKVFISKLQHENQLIDAVAILLEVKRLNARDASRIKTELENYLSNDTLKDTVFKAIAHLEEIREDKNDHKARQ